ncbi:hypothetical protein OF83DRAFT_1294790 [Amylostereum chailletii]|nr:hypothetical protein OF83DRAFT_1294790 [Amylostereum chailletii]
MCRHRRSLIPSSSVQASEGPLDPVAFPPRRQVRFLWNSPSTSAPQRNWSIHPPIFSLLVTRTMATTQARCRFIPNKRRVTMNEQADDEEDENESADEDQTPLWVSILEEYGHLHGIASDKLKAIAWKMQADRLKATDTLSVERFAEEVLEVYLDLTAYTSDVDDDTEDDTRSDCSSGCPACAVKAKLERGRAVDSDESDWDKDYEDEDEDEDEDDEKALRGATFRGPLVPARRPVMDRQEPVPVVNGFDALRELVDAMEVLDTLCTVYSKYRHKNLPRFETQVQGDSLRFDGGIPSLSW